MQMAAINALRSRRRVTLPSSIKIRVIVSLRSESVGGTVVEGGAINK